MSASYGGQAAHWIITPAQGFGKRADVEPPEIETQAPSPAKTPAGIPTSLDLPRFFYELEAFFQSARALEAEVLEARRINAELRDQMKRREVEQDRHLAEAQERVRVLSERLRKADERDRELLRAREQWRLCHEKMKAVSTELQSREKRVEELEQELSGAERARADAALAMHEKETALGTLSYEREALLKKIHDFEIRRGQWEHRCRAEKEARERIEVYAKSCYQELLKARRRGDG